MYSVLLVAALTATDQTEGFGCRGRRCSGCNGAVCSGGCSGGCSGSCSGGRMSGGVYYSNGGTFARRSYYFAPAVEEIRGPDMAPATIIVTLPDEARLTIDGNRTTAAGGRRVFMTPPVPKGSKFTYNLEAEILRDGRPVSVSREVTVSGGAESEVRLEFPRPPDGKSPPDGK